MTPHQSAETSDASEGVFLVKVTAWVRIPKADMEPLTDQRDVAEWIVDEYLGVAPFVSDYGVAYAKVEVRDKANRLGGYLVSPNHWRTPDSDGGSDG